MRIDHHSFQRATRVAGMGLLLQTILGLAVLVFGLISHDTAFIFASAYVLAGFLVWLGLVIVFYQHRLERLEALEDDELASTRGAAGSFFERASEETKVAARRLAMMHKWLMPAISIVLALVLAGMAVLMFRYMKLVGDGLTEFQLSPERGWAVAICLAFAAFSFIFSRFVAGMSKQEAWHNLRGGAAYMVGNTVVLVAVAVGIIFRFFDNQSVIRGIAWGIPILLAALSLEILLNFVLNLYRPRIPGEVPRPSFDSKALSLLSTPDSIVRSLNEAVNYQFGFDVTSSWGYQLLLRSFASLLMLGLVVLILLSTMVVVEPHQQAIRLRGGQIVGDKIYQSGVMWKLPWPIETAEIYDVTRIRRLHLTAEVVQDMNLPVEARIGLWSTPETPKTDEPLEPFIVGSPAAARELNSSSEPSVTTVSLNQSVVSSSQPQQAIEDKAAETVSKFYSLVDAEIVLQYRIRRNNNGLLDFLSFAPETAGRRQMLTDRERSLKYLALAQVSSQLSRLSLDDVLSPGRTKLTADLVRLVQAAFDAHRTGVEVVSIDVPMLRPSGGSAPTFEDFGISEQGRLQMAAIAERNVYATFTSVIGDPNLADEVLAGIDEYDRLARTAGKEDEALKQRQAVEKILVNGGGEAAQMIADAQTNRWIDLMNQRVQNSLVKGEIDAYVSAPELYRTRELMKLYKRVLPYRNKIILGVDPSRVNIDFDLKSINPAFNFAGASEEEKKK